MNADISPQEAVRRLRKYWPASLGYNIHIEAELASYGNCEFWPEGRTFLEYSVMVRTQGWYHCSKHLDGECYDKHASIREAVEAMERFLPWVEPQEQVEAPLFAMESEVAA
jgi:hypothetical protein